MAKRTLDTPAETFAKTVAPAAASAAAVLASVTPSILSLGEHYAAADAAHMQFDSAHAPEGFLAEQWSKSAQHILADQMDSLLDLITTLPAATVADVAVQIHASGIISGRLAACEYTTEQVYAMADQLERMAYGMLPIVAAAAGLDMEKMGWAGGDGLRVQRFAGVGVRS